MRKLYKLKKDSSVIYSNTITEYLNPEYIYIEMKPNYHLLVKSNDEVLKGQVILENNLNKIISPVSGNIINIAKKNIDGILKDVLVIQNNFTEKEKRYYHKKSNGDKESIISTLYRFYFKYIASVFETKILNNLIILGFDDEPYILNNSYIFKKYYKEILELADFLNESFLINNTVLVLKNNDNQNIEKYLSKINSYPNLNLKLIEDKYLLKEPYFLLEYLNLKDNDTLIVDAKTFLEMYYALKYNSHFYDTFVTIAGPSVTKSMVMQAKIGTSFKDALTQIKIKDNDVLYILNGLMKGYNCDINNTIISKNTSGLIIIPREISKEYSCLNCGLCYKVCPVKVNPKKVMTTHKVSPNCLDCGLCTYICPSHINLRKYLEGEYE